MNRRSAWWLLASCAVLVAAGEGRAGDISVYGLELEVSDERERLLIFADAPIEPQLVPVDDRTLMIALPGSRLDASAPTNITPSKAGTIARVTAFDRADPPPEVRVVVQHRPGAPPRVERRASVVAIDFEPLQRAAPASDDTINISYHNAPISQVMTELARATGEALVFDDSVSGLGSVTIEGPGQASRGEALALIDSLLLLRGYAAVPAPGGVRKIIPINGAPSPWVPDAKLPDTDAPVTTLLRLETVEAVDLVPVLTPYLGAHSTATAFAPTNSLILSGPSSLLRTLRTAIEALDEIDTGAPLIWRMRYASARTVADQLLEIAGDRDVLYVSADERRNALLLRVRPGEVDHVRALVDRLDRPPRGVGGMHVIKLRYADPERLVEQLHALRDASAPEDPGGAPLLAGLRGRAFEVVADVPTHSLVVRAPPETIDAVLDLVAEIDRLPATVRLEITIASIEIDDRLDLGADFLIPSITHVNSPDDIITTVISNPSGGGIQTLPSAQKPFVAAYTKAPLLVTLIDPVTGNPFTISIPRESGSITMNDRTVRTDLLLQPKLLMASGEEHEIFAGDNIPIATSQTQEGETGTGTSNAFETRQDIERQDVGTLLRATPTVGEQGGVRLELLVEVSQLVPSLAGDVEQVGPTLQDIRVESVIRLRDGEVAVVATAARPIVSHSETGTPGSRTSGDRVGVPRHHRSGVQAPPADRRACRDPALRPGRPRRAARERAEAGCACGARESVARRHSISPP